MKPPSPPIPDPLPIFTPPPPTSTFAITGIQPNATIPDNPAAGVFLRFDGTIDIPAGAAYNDQVVITFWFNNNGTKGPPVRGLSPQYSTVNGQAAMGTALYPVPPQGLQTTWAAWIPYGAMHLNAGSWVQTPAGPQYQPAVSYLLAEPMLYLDGFGVATGPLVAFQVLR
jgi:hypothetical protein